MLPKVLSRRIRVTPDRVGWWVLNFLGYLLGLLALNADTIAISPGAGRGRASGYFFARCLIPSGASLGSDVSLSPPGPTSILKMHRSAPWARHWTSVTSYFFPVAQKIASSSSPSSAKQTGHGAPYISQHHSHAAILTSKPSSRGTNS